MLKRLRRFFRRTISKNDPEGDDDKVHVQPTCNPELLGADEYRKLETIIDTLAGGVMVAQADAMAAKHVARELLVDVARLQENPSRYVTTLYDRVIARLDPRETLTEKTAIGLARDLVGAIFRDALQALQSSQSPPDGAPPKG
jgi:hypothetical protein